MGFPVPLADWMKGPARDFVGDVFSSRAARERDLIDNAKVLKGLTDDPRFGRKAWGLLCLELWQRQFHDRQHEFTNLQTSEGQLDEGPDHGRGRLYRLPSRRSAAS